MDNLDAIYRISPSGVRIVAYVKTQAQGANLLGRLVRSLDPVEIAEGAFFRAVKSGDPIPAPGHRDRQPEWLARICDQQRSPRACIAGECHNGRPCQNNCDHRDCG